jgi:hypothetical protein
MPEHEDRKNLFGRWRMMDIVDDKKAVPREPSYRIPKIAPPEIPSTSVFENLEYYYTMMCNYRDWLHDAATNNGKAITSKRVSISDSPFEIF